MGWDDNGLPTERRVQNYFGVRCDPSLPYDPDFTPPEKPDPKRQVPIDRPQLHRALRALVAGGRDRLRDALPARSGCRSTGRYLYTTIGDDSRPPRSGPSCATSPVTRPTSPDVADALGRHLPDRRRPGRARGARVPRALPPDRLPPARRSSGVEIRVHIETTRPELIPACVALIAHPDDERYQPLFGTTVTSPVFGVEIPVLAHHLAEPDKGAGIAMCCTFGDLTDVQWWRELQLPVRTVIERDGRLQPRDPRVAHRRRRGDGVRRAGRQDDVLRPRGDGRACSASRGDLEGEPTPTTRMANFYEKGDKPLEIVSTRQWYIRNGGRDADLREAMVERGDEIDVDPRPHAPPLRQLGQRPQRRLADLAAALLRHPVPGLVPARRRRRARLRPPAAPGAEESLPVDPSTRRPAGVRRGPARQARTASSATPTSWTPGRRRR